MGSGRRASSIPPTSTWKSRKRQRDHLLKEGNVKRLLLNLLLLSPAILVVGFMVLMFAAYLE
jgi:hypothetical protein